MLDHVRYAMGLALRLGATPPMLAMRWAGALRSQRPAWNGTPAPRWDVSLLSKVLLDELFLASEFVSGSVLALESGDRTRCEIEAADALYRKRGWSRRPESFHQAVSALRVEDIRDVRSAWGSYRHMRFTAEYVPHPGEPGRDRWLSYRPNRTGHVWLLEHPGAPRPWKLCVPGYRMGHPAVDFAAFRARWLHEQLGLNVAIPVMPLHGPRRIGRRSGDGYLNGNFLDIVHAQAQAVSEVRALICWLRGRGAPGVGIHGISLGAYTASLVASLERGLDFVIAGIPAVDYLSLLGSHVPQPLQRMAAERGFEAETIRRVLRVISPLALKARVRKSRRFVYAGRADQLATPEQARALWRHWERPNLAWYDGSHISFVWEEAVEGLLLKALRSSGFIQAAAREQSLATPTQSA